MWQQVRPQRLWREVPRGQVADTASWEGWNYRGTGGEDGALRKFKRVSPLWLGKKTEDVGGKAGRLGREWVVERVL